MATVAKKPAKPKPWTAARIKALREGRGLLQKEAAAWLRISQQLWAEWESGRRKPVPPMQLLLDLLDRGELPPPDSAE